MKNRAILYVEDEEDDVFFMKKAFQLAGIRHPLHTAEDGQKAIAYLSGEPPFADRSQFPIPSLVILDLNLPILSGFEVLQWLRRRPEYAQTHVVVFSSSGRPEDREKATSLGATEYVMKPSSGFDFIHVAKQLQAKWLRNGSERTG
ncbi:two-component system response regulator [Opitutaceae bacterium EW11]|nr:two-component system response regulator [Opitutaceae bacterium EW11]